jgi:hypothetical protein
MNRTSWILIGLMAVIAVVSMFMLSDPDHAARLAQAQRDATLSPAMRDIFLGGLVLAIGGYLAWFFLIRKE